MAPHAPPAAFPFIPNARPHSIDDRQLEQLAQLGDDARMGNVTPAEAEWVLISCGPLLRELLARRRVMAQAGMAVDLSNVIVIGGQ